MVREQISRLCLRYAHELLLKKGSLYYSDIPAHTYQLTFEPNLDWPKFYASSKDIHKYWKKVVAKYGCMKYIKLQHQIVEARWVAEESKWHVQVSTAIPPFLRPC